MSKSSGEDWSSSETEDRLSSFPFYGIQATSLFVGSTCSWVGLPPCLLACMSVITDTSRMLLIC